MIFLSVSLLQRNYFTNNKKILRRCLESYIEKDSSMIKNKTAMPF